MYSRQTFGLTPELFVAVVDLILRSLWSWGHDTVFQRMHVLIVLFVISCCIRSLLLFRKDTWWGDSCTLCKRQLLRPKGISNCQILGGSSYCKYSRHSLRRRYIFTCMKFLLPYCLCVFKSDPCCYYYCSLLPYSQFLMSKMSKLLQTMGPHVSCFLFVQHLCWGISGAYNGPIHWQGQSILFSSGTSCVNLIWARRQHLNVSFVFENC